MIRTTLRSTGSSVSGRLSDQSSGIGPGILTMDAATFANPLWQFFGYPSQCLSAR
jgi:hypothetical protein